MGSKKKQMLRELRQVALRLPTVTIQSKALVSGEEILKRQPNAKDAEGNPIQPERTYQVPVTQPINKTRAMKKILKKEGIEGVNRYIKSVCEAHNGNKRMMEGTVGGLIDRTKSITHGF